MICDGFIIPYFLNFLIQHPEEFLLTLRGVDAPAGGAKETASQSSEAQLETLRRVEPVTE